MSYLVLARKWRPATFSDLVGQGHVSRTLENAIAQNRVAHAFLFTGVRGVGKTTSARILAKALNCEKGPTAHPCLVCPACVDIAAGNDVDVQELDGASNNGVDEVRRLQDSLPYRPQRDRFKIFIVDEVHMLSNNAWNAFLKTLEEPPPHVKFIFATTEVHKVPSTILSRVQRYDFKMIAAKTIGERLRYVLGEEKIEADDAAIALLSREAAGSMRDAMSLLDQAIAWSPAGLVGEEVARVLGVASRQKVHAIATALVDAKAEAALVLVGEMVEQGQDLTNLARNLLLHLRDLVVAKICATDGAALLDLTEDERREIGELAARAETDDLLRLHQGFSKAFDDTVRSVQPRAALEMTLVRLARRPALLPLDDLLQRLGELDKRLGGGGPGGGGGGSGGARPQPPVARTFPSDHGPSGGTGSGPRGAVGVGNTALASAAPSFAEPIRASAPPRLQSVPAFEPAREPSRFSPPQPAVSPPRPAPPPLSRLDRDPTPSRLDQPESPAHGPAPFHEREPAPAAPAPPRGFEMPRAIRPGGVDGLAPLPPARPNVDMVAFRAFTDAIEGVDKALASKLKTAVPTEASKERVVVAFPPGNIHFESMRDAMYEATLKTALEAWFGSACALSFEADAEASRGLTVAHLEAAERAKREAEERAEVTAHPIVAAAIAALGAEVRDVKIHRAG